jgi:hypothetical protein
LDRIPERPAVGVHVHPDAIVAHRRLSNLDSCIRVTDVAECVHRQLRAGRGRTLGRRQTDLERRELPQLLATTFAKIVETGQRQLHDSFRLTLIDGDGDTHGSAVRGDLGADDASVRIPVLRIERFRCV